MKRNAPYSKKRRSSRKSGRSRGKGKSLRTYKMSRGGIKL